MASLRHWFAVVFALVYAAGVITVDATAAAPYRFLGVYVWAVLISTGVFAGLGLLNWVNVKTIVPPGALKPREAAFFIAGVAAAASITGRAVAELPVARAFTTIPNWPAFYLVLFFIIVAAGAYLWLRGCDLKPWGLFTVLVLAGVNGQTFNLAAGGFGVLFGYTVVLYFFHGAPWGAYKPRISYVGTALIIFLLAAAASFLWSQDLSGSFRVSVFLANGFLIFLIFAREIENADVLTLPAALVWAVLVTEVAFEAALAAKFVLVSRWISLNIPLENLFWTMGVSRNALSTYFVAALPLLLLAAKAPKPAAPRWFLWAQVVVSAALPVVSLSKSAILGLAVVLWLAFAFWGTERRMNLKLIVTAAGLVAAAVAAGLLIVPGGVARYFNALTYTSRFLMLRVVYAAVRDHPLTGVGLGNGLAWVGQARVLSPDELVSVPEFLMGHSHNVFLEAAGAMGLPGLIALVIVIQSAVWAGSNLIKVEDDRFFFGMVSAAVAGLGAILTFALGLALLSPIPVILFIGLAMYEGGIRRRGLAGHAPPWLAAGFAVLVIIVSAAALLSVASAQERTRGESFLRVGDYAAAEGCFGRAAALAPWDAGSRGRLASCRVARGDIRGALEAARAAARRARGNAALAERVGLLYWLAGEEKPAGDYLARAVAADRAGLIGGPHYAPYALYLATGRDYRGARAVLTDGLLVDRWPARDAAFVVTGPENGGRTVLRPLVDRDELAAFVFARLGRPGYGPASLRRRIPAAPPAYGRDLCLESIYCEEFRDSFSLSRSRGGIARPVLYRLGEGYAETRLRAGAVFEELEAVKGLSPRDPRVALTLFPSRHRDVERHRWEIESLVGMALLAVRTDKTAAVPEITEEFFAKANAVQGRVAGVGEPVASKIKRLRYYQLTDEQPEWDLELADALLATGQPRAAGRDYERALKLLVARDVGARDGRLADAVRGLSKCRALTAPAGAPPRPAELPFIREPSPSALAARALTAEFYGEYKNALILWRRAARSYPGDPAVALALADFYEKRDLGDEGAAVLADAARRGDVEVRHAHAEAVLRSGDAAGAAALYAGIEKDVPGDILAYLAQARIYAAYADFDKAASALFRARANIPANSLWAARYGAMLVAAGESDRAAVYYAWARRLDPFDLEPYVAWGEELCRRGRRDEALVYLRAASEIDPDSSWARLALAECYRRADKDAEARRTYEEGIAREGFGSPVTLAYDVYLEGRGDKAGRRAVLEEGVKKDPGNPTLRFRWGELLLASGEPERGRRLLVEAVTLEPTSADANAALGYYYFTHGEAARSVPYFENARAAAPGAAGDRFRILLADALIETGAYRDALATLAPVADPTRLAKTYFLKAKAYCKMGDRRSASAAATLALRYDPTMKEAETFITK